MKIMQDVCFVIGCFSFHAAKDHWRPLLDPEAWRDFCSLMLWYPIIPLVYILSLPSLRQPSYRGKELWLCLCHAPLSKQIEKNAVCELLITVGTDVKVDIDWETGSNTHGHICTQSQSLVTALSVRGWSCCSTTIDFRLLQQDSLFLYVWALDDAVLVVGWVKVVGSCCCSGRGSFGFMAPCKWLSQLTDVKFIRLMTNPKMHFTPVCHKLVQRSKLLRYYMKLLNLFPNAVYCCWCKRTNNWQRMGLLTPLGMVCKNCGMLGFMWSHIILWALKLQIHCHASLYRRGISMTSAPHLECSLHNHNHTHTHKHTQTHTHIAAIHSKFFSE